MYQKIKIIFIFIAISISGFGQDLNKDFEEIISKMKSTESYTIQVGVKAYSRKGGTLITSTSASLTKLKENSKSVVGALENVETEKYRIKVDHEEREVLVFKKEKARRVKSSKSSVNLDEFKEFLESNPVQSSAKIALTSQSDGVKNYSITGIEGLIEVKIKLDMNQKTIISISYEYGQIGGDQNTYVELDYSTFRYDVDLTSEFEMSQYFSIENKNYKVSNALTGYTLYTEE